MPENDFVEDRLCVEIPKSWAEEFRANFCGRLFRLEGFELHRDVETVPGFGPYPTKVGGRAHITFELLMVEPRATGSAEVELRNAIEEIGEKECCKEY